MKRGLGASWFTRGWEGPANPGFRASFLASPGPSHPTLGYESQPVGLAEVISASEASLGGPGGRASQMCKNRVK